MPVPAIGYFALEGGFFEIPYIFTILKTIPCLFALYVLKVYFGGARNTSERDMHSKVIMITGGTSGVGAALAHDLASRGAQLILLTHHPIADPFLSDYIFDLRASTSNELITAETVDLASLHSIRLFATKWIDNAPPRRLDMVILCANTLTPRGADVQVSEDGVEANWAVNYLANFHLLGILSPAIRAQPADRDVRVLVGACSSYMAGRIPDAVPMPRVRGSGSSSKSKSKSKGKDTTTPAHPAAYASSKLALMTFAAAFQKHLAAYERPDKAPNNARVLMVDPGYTRTPGMRRWLSFGSLWGLGLYLLTWPFWWLVLKSPEQGAQSFLMAAMEAQYGRGEGGVLIKECMEYKVVRDEVYDEESQKRLWEMSERAIEALEKEGAVRRAGEKRERERVQKEKEEREKEAKVTEVVEEVGEKDGKNGIGEKTPASRRTRKKA